MNKREVITLVALVLLVFVALVVVKLPTQSGGAFAFIGEEYQEDFPYDGKPNLKPQNREVPQLRKHKGNTYYGHGIPLRDKPAGPMDQPALPIVHNMGAEIVPESNGFPFSTDRGAIAARSADITQFFFKR